MSSPPKDSASPQNIAARFGRLRLGVVLFGVLAMVVFVAETTFDVWKSYRHTVMATEREISNLSAALAEQTAWTAQAVDLLLLDTARWYREDAPLLPADQIDTVLAARTEAAHEVRIVTLIDAQGQVRHRSQGDRTQRINISDRPHFQALRDHPGTGLYVSDPLLSRATDRQVILFSRRLEDDRGQFTGIVSATVDLEDLRKFYSAVNLDMGTSTYLLRQDGRLIIRNPPAAAEINDQQDFVAMSPVRDTPLEVGVTRSRDVALRPWRNEAIRIAIRTLALTVLGIWTVVAILRQLRHIEAGENALRASEERYALAMEGANEGFWDWHIPTDRLFMSPRMKILQGRSPETEIYSRASWLSTIDIHPEDKPRVETAVNDHIAGRTARYESEYRVRHPDGEWRWLRARGQCLRDESGHPVRFLGSVLDITAEKHAQVEKERLEEQLRQSQKMEAIGTLAGGIAHDFNNILGAILGYGELAQQSAAEGSAQRRHLDSVMHAAERAKTLVDRILGFSRSGIGERVPVNIQFVVEETLELLEASLPPGIVLEKSLRAGDAAVIGDTTRLHQVAMNLCTNAMQAMASQGGVLSVALEREQLTESRRLSRGTLTPGLYVRFVIADTGSGIAPEVLARIFDPFFTTKGVGEGTGLGLSLVHGIVTDLGGAIDLSSSVGRGTRFEIWLPVTGETHKPAVENRREPPIADGETVLIVDDERPLLTLAEEILASLGYEPVGFDSSAAALRAFQAQPQRFDAILTDEAMPELTGTDLAREIRRLRADVPIILMSGYGGTQLAARAAASGVSEVLRKPLQSYELAEALARVLEPAHEST